MVDCLADLILRPDADRPPVGIDLQRDRQRGHPAPAATSPARSTATPFRPRLVRELAYTLGLLPRPAARRPLRPADTGPTADRRRPTPTRPSRPHADRSTARRATTRRRTEPDADPGASPPRRPAPEPGSGGAGLAELLDLRTVAGTALTHLPTIAVVDELSGQLLALTNATEIRHAATCGRPACRTGRRALHPPAPRPGLGPPPPTPGYGPSAAAAAVRPRPRPALPLPRLPGRRHPLRPRPQPALARRTHLRRQPLLPVPPPPPAQPPGPRLDHAPPARRRPGMDHPRRPPDHHPPAALRHRRPPATAGRPTAGRPTDDQPTPHPDRTRPRPTPPTRHHRPRPRAVLMRGGTRVSETGSPSTQRTPEVDDLRGSPRTNRGSVHASIRRARPCRRGCTRCTR